LVKIYSLFQLKFLDENFFFKYLLDSKKRFLSGDRKQWRGIFNLIHPVQPAKIQTPNTGSELLRGTEELGSTPGKRKILQKKRKTPRR